MNHGSSRLYPGESGELVNGLTNLEASEADGVEPFVVHSAHQVRRQIPIWPGENKRLSARAQNNLLHPCLSVFFFSILVYVESHFSICSNQAGKNGVYLSGWWSFSAIHDVNWDPACSSIPSLDDGLSASWQFQVSPLSLLPWPFSSLPSPTIPGAPLRILLRSRPLSPKAGLNPFHRSSWEFPPQRSRPGSPALTLLHPAQPALKRQKAGPGLLPASPQQTGPECYNGVIVSTPAAAGHSGNMSIFKNNWHNLCFCSFPNNVQSNRWTLIVL